MILEEDTEEEDIFETYKKEKEMMDKFRALLRKGTEYKKNYEK